MTLSSSALARPRFTLLGVLFLALAGLWLALDFPSTEEPPVTVRAATIVSFVPGASVARVEQLVVRPTEEAIRSIPDVKKVKSTVRPGFAFTYVELRPTVSPERLPTVWQRLRARMEDIRPSLPEGTTGPLVDDEFGRVAVMTVGLTGPGYTSGEIRRQARVLRDELQRLDGVERVSLHGIRDEQVQIVLDPQALAAKGLSPAAVAAAVSRRNIVAPAGFVEPGGAYLPLTVTGDAARPEQLATTPIALPAGGTVPLGMLARIERIEQDPPLAGAFVGGTPAAVLAVSMAPGLNVVSFAERLRQDIQRLEAGLPAGMAVVPITDQAQIVTRQLRQVGQVFLETTAIVMGIVVLFLGLRTGLIVGAIVPTTVLGTLAVMKLLGIELHVISIGAIIIALGLFVDNAIVVAEDMERRLALGESRQDAAAHAGGSMFVPLLVSSLAIILSFMPLVLSRTETGEYLRSLGVVMTVTLLVSLLLAVTFTPLLCQWFAHAHPELSRAARAVDALTDWYRSKVRWVLRHRWAYIGTMAALLAGAAWLFTTVPTELMPASERRQIQMAVELAPDASTRQTLQTAADISRALADRQALPQIENHVIYMGDGGPRFILALNPPVPAGHRAYAVLTLAQGVSHADAIAAVRSTLNTRFPHVRFEPKRFAMGSSDSGLAEFRIKATDLELQQAAGQRLLAALRAVPGMGDVATDDAAPILQLNVEVDQVRAQAAGVSSAEIARNLDLLLAGTTITQYREGDTLLPVVLRGGDELRRGTGALVSLPIQRDDGRGHVPLGQVASLAMESQPAVIQRYNQERVITVSGKHPQLTAQGVVDRVAPLLDELRRDGVQIALGGEIEEGGEANNVMAQFLPPCVLAMALIFVWQFESLRKAAIVLASVPFVLIGATVALKLTGTTLTFVGTLGLLALGGIIVNNAVLLLDAIDEARSSGLPGAAAIEDAAAKRLRPIVMTKLVCILGLLPLYLFGGSVWASLAVVMMGGLALGTLITLGLIPALYAALHRIAAPAA